MSRKPEQQQQRQSSSRCSFGVKSYVHKFYENRSADYDESVYEATGSANPNGEEDQIALTSPPKYPCAYSKRWKRFAYIGTVLLVLGVIQIAFTHSIPLKKAIVGYQNGEPLVDQKAAFFDREVELATIIGLSVVLIGGIIIAVSVLLPAFFKDEDEYPPDYVIRVPVNKVVYKRLSKADDQIPYSGKIASVQPESSTSQSNKILDQG
ncbi:neurensin-1-like [Convolutriloba macropyga]|uniref:neurensin-1-like n=1 Tax=Convolutriloba macropyga TaxID=536237 RepID=UPI003F526DA8